MTFMSHLPWPRRALARLARGYIHLIQTTLRVDYRPSSMYLEAVRQGPVIFAFWHGRQLPLFWFLSRLPHLVVPVSHSRDGDLQARVLTELGVRVVRGSSSRHGEEALLGLVRGVRQGGHAGVAVDGPRGPAGQVAPGVIALAQVTQAPIVPITAAARPAHTLKSTWDHYLLPSPLARAAVVVGDPLLIPRALARHDRPLLAAHLARRLHGITAHAEALMGLPSRPGDEGHPPTGSPDRPARL